MRGNVTRVTLKRCIKEVFQMYRSRVFSELWQFMKYNKKFWLAPIIIVLLMIGLLLAVTSSSALAPFIYTLF